MPLLSVPAADGVQPAKLSERDFYSRYEWCLNPIPTLDDALLRIREELARYDSLGADWQRAEAAINLYLLVCGVSCTLGDYLGRTVRHVPALCRRFPRLRRFIRACGDIPKIAHLFRERRVEASKARWDAILDCVCDALAAGPGDPFIARIRTQFERVAGAGFAAGARRWRMRIPEAFRCQDLTHHDVLEMADAYAEAAGAPLGRVVVVGLRTAGAYFAPLVRARLQLRGIAAAWMTVRPKQGLSRGEERRLRKLASGGVSVIVVDDHPNTGHTFRLMLSLLAESGVRRDRVTILAPEHPAQSDWKSSVWPAGVVTLPVSRFFKRTLLEDPRAILSLFREFGSIALRIDEAPEVVAINARFEADCARGFQVRLKRLFRLRCEDARGRSATEYVLAKSVGWGWLGYHAYVSAGRLSGMVPEVLGLRDGLLFEKWMGEGGDAPSTHTMACYIAARARRLALPEDPCYDTPGYRWTGWDAIARALSGVYGYRLGRMKTGAVMRALGDYVSPVPALIDGRMLPEDWVGGSCKTDFEQHNFGGAELDVVDPAYDLASAVFEFGLSETAEGDLVDEYVRHSGDRTVTERLPLYKLLYGLAQMATAARKAGAEPAREAADACNRRCLASRRFLTRHANRRFRSAAGAPGEWSARLFFLDLDGVFDAEFFGFPTTTPSGLKALELLRGQGWSVVLNTGRSIEEVREYCRNYDLPGGVAEYGCVFLDAVRGVERVLVDDESMAQLAACRTHAARVPGLLHDPAYRCAVRIYRYSGGRASGLSPVEARQLLTRSGCDRLRFLCRDADTYIVPRGVNKGQALRAVASLVGCVEATVAMGDSMEDLEMLKEADRAYIPANGVGALRAVACEAGFRVTRSRLQRGLLEAAADLTGRKPVAAPEPVHLIDRLLKCADRSPWERYLALLTWRSV